jgi:hypothetical protein
MNENHRIVIHDSVVSSLNGIASYGLLDEDVTCLHKQDLKV